MLALDDIESSDAGADHHASALGNIRSDLETGLGDREVSGGDGVLNEQPHLLDFFFLDVLEGIEAFDFSGDGAGIGGGVKARDGRDAGLSGENRLPAWLRADAKSRNQA